MCMYVMYDSHAHQFMYVSVYDEMKKGKAKRMQPHANNQCSTSHGNDSNVCG